MYLNHIYTVSNGQLGTAYNKNDVDYRFSEGEPYMIPIYNIYNIKT